MDPDESIELVSLASIPRFQSKLIGKYVHESCHWLFSPQKRLQQMKKNKKENEENEKTEKNYNNV